MCPWSSDPLAPMRTAAARAIILAVPGNRFARTSLAATPSPLDGGKTSLRVSQIPFRVLVVTGMVQDLFDHRSNVVVLQAIEDVASLPVAGGEV